MSYYVIEGNIGVGKTSLVKMLSEELNARAIYEQFEENPFLPKFYDNPGRYSFPLELSFLADRYKQFKQELTDRDMFSPVTIADYYFSKSLIFAGVTLEPDEYNLYRNLYTIIHRNLPKPELYVYLHCSVDKLLQNIAVRGRDYEKSISADYLKKIQNGYYEYFKTVENLKILVLETENLDFVNNREDFFYIKNYIFDNQFENGITRIPVNTI